MSEQNAVKTICHMLVSLDGKIAGPEVFSVEGMGYFLETYYGIDKTHIQPRTPICFTGRKSIGPEVPSVEPSAYPAAAPGSIPRTDYWAELTATSRPPASKRFLAVVDTHGSIGWTQNTVAGRTFHFHDGDRMIVILVEDRVTDAYLAHLQKLHIPYVFAGKSELDVRVAAEKLARYFGVDTVSLHGGGTLNGSFLHQGLIDELSLIQLPVIAGNPSEPGLVTPPAGLDKTGSAAFAVDSVEKLEHNGLWVRYHVKRTSE